MAMNSNELKATARQMTIEAIMPALMDNKAVKFADASFAILQEVEGQEIWTEITVKTKAYKDTKVSKAFNPYTAAEEWEAERRIKDENNAIKAAEKAAKVAKAKKKEEEA
jgi:phage/plasmid-associated DNA primase